MMKECLFFVVILLANIIQGITGFAGTILAMPVSLMLVGYNTAKPVLNVLGLLSGIYVFVGQHKAVNWKEVRRIVGIMAVGIGCGILLKSLLEGKEQILYILLGVFVIFLAVKGLYEQFAAGRKAAAAKGTRDAAPGDVQADREAAVPGNAPDVAFGEDGAGGRSVVFDCASGEDRILDRVGAHGKGTGRRGKRAAADFALLGAAGVVHGIFVSGGPLLIGYLSGKIKDKTGFRATISTVWIVLNSIILIDDIRSGLWNPALLKTQLIAIPFLLAGMAIGSILYKKMSQKVFMVLTYVLLFLSGCLLLVK